MTDPNVADELANWVLRINKLCNEKEAEIARLQAAMRESGRMHVETQDLMQAEIARLQAALLQIANLNGVSTRLDAQKVANRALEPKP